MHKMRKSEAQLTWCFLQNFYSWNRTQHHPHATERFTTLRFAQQRKIALKTFLEELFAQINFVAYLLFDTYSDHVTAPKSFSITVTNGSQMGVLGTHSTFRIHLAADSGHWN
jgi:hypothetical protein